jgi:hypothetical protein
MVVILPRRVRALRRYGRVIATAAGRPHTPHMDGFVRGIGEAIAGLMVALLSVVGNAIDGVIGALTSVVPWGLLPVVGLVVVVLVVVAVFRR